MTKLVEHTLGYNASEVASSVRNVITQHIIGWDAKNNGIVKNADLEQHYAVVPSWKVQSYQSKHGIWQWLL